MAKVKKICEQCGEIFYVIPSRKDIARFCSWNCYCTQNIGEKAANWKGRKVKRICKQCGKEFEIFQSRINRGWGIFCSKECMGKWNSEFRIGKNSPTWKGGEVKRFCLLCGKEFPEQPAKVKRGWAKFCSKKCHSEWMSKNLRGKNSPQWRGGVSFEPYCHKFNNEFKEYIREKFGRVCFLCPKTEEDNGRRLSVHHVNYNKDCGCDDDESCQFVSLCIGCNAKVNFNRDMWEKKIKDKMQNKLNGWYI